VFRRERSQAIKERLPKIRKLRRMIVDVFRDRQPMKLTVSYRQTFGERSRRHTHKVYNDKTKRAHTLNEKKYV
jgi:hypothetical protein